MKVEKINENKLKITLTLEELKKREVTVKDIEKNSDVAKNLFIDLIEEYNLDEDFEFDDSQLFIEANYDNNNLFIVTITKIDDLPELKKYALIESNLKKAKKSSKSNKASNNINYTVNSNIFAFKNLDDIFKMCDTAKYENLFFGKNNLYKFKDEYFIIFSKSSIKNKKFMKTFVFLSEFCKEYYSFNMFEVSLKEKSKLIIENRALQNLSKI